MARTGGADGGGWRLQILRAFARLAPAAGGLAAVGARCPVEFGFFAVLPRFFTVAAPVPIRRPLLAKTPLPVTPPPMLQRMQQSILAMAMF